MVLTPTQPNTHTKIKAVAPELTERVLLTERLRGLESRETAAPDHGSGG